jgi:hypothetical protein
MGNWQSRGGESEAALKRKREETQRVKENRDRKVTKTFYSLISYS